jgi:hypothetical protein
MTTTPFTLAPAGWYARAGDPPMLLRWWDGQAWTREVRGPLPPDPFPIQALVDGRERQNAPLAGRPWATVPPGWAAAPWKQPKPMTRSRKVLLLIGLLVGVLAFGGLGYFANWASGPRNQADLKIGKCVTIAAPPLSSSTGNRVSWTSSDCQTAAGGPVSYQVTQKLNGSASCGKSQFIEMYLTKDGKKISVTSTYCLMENLTGGECIYSDAKNYEFDVPCTDTRAVAKVTKRVEQGSGVTCGTREVPLAFNPPGRTYCLAKP